MILLSGCIRFGKDTTDTIYLIPEAYEEMVTETTEYKITIGSISTDFESDSNFVLFINGVMEEKLDELGTIVRQFTGDTITRYNHGIEKNRITEESTRFQVKIPCVF
ncbi:hypothetical protein COI41_24910 [Bacillus toyonensis]|nr:hypothetical protein CN567_30885 [Bacillus toyonensis]PFX73550.1 hypothetical protein COL38_30955 [Bacillus toyonensis]PGB06487.1 hypothetical protein COL98_26730 [Bacillus toyonensis]PHF51058.1 hypothetical protein COI41_24910 [Bacillus toyonensis]